MPVILTKSTVEFLERVERLHRAGLSLRQIAEQMEVSPTTITNRLIRAGFDARTEIVDLRTGEKLGEMLASGAIVAAEPAAVAA